MYSELAQCCFIALHFRFNKQQILTDACLMCQPSVFYNVNLKLVAMTPSPSSPASTVHTVLSIFKCTHVYNEPPICLKTLDHYCLLQPMRQLRI